MKRIFLLCFLGLCTFGGAFLATLVTPRLTAPSMALAQPPAPAADPHTVAAAFEAVVRKVAPAVVAIEASKPNATSLSGKARPVEESGSGVVVRAEGRGGLVVLTNNHVITQASPQQITVTLADGRLLHPGQVWADPETDLAILRLDNVTDLPAAPLGDSDRVRVGQWVLAIGSPFGLNQTVTHGIISARERGEVSLGSSIRIKDFLQTDAAINPGSSGGPLVNLDGEVIGLNTAIASTSGNNSGVAFSIPVNLVKRVMGQLLQNGQVSRGYLGMQLARSFDADMAFRLGLDRAQGALVEQVYPDMPAAAAGLRANDVVLAVDEVAIRSENHFITLVTSLPPGRKINLRVWRDRKTVTLQAVVGDWSQGKSRFRTGP